MHLNPKGLGITLGVVWGAGVFCVAVAHLIWPGYGGAFLDFIASIYPGYHVGGFGQAIVGTAYGALDGGVGGAVIAWLYNVASGAGSTAS